MPELLTDDTPINDPSLSAGNDTALPELGKPVSQSIEYFNQQFGLDINDQGNLQMEPTEEQLSRLKDWHEATSSKGIIMPDIDTFTAKMVLARALLPQRDEGGNVVYLFGKGAGAELALQGDVEGRAKQIPNVPYRTHSDFEIYGAKTDNWDNIPHGDRFKTVFGGQEIYPVSNTKGLHDLPPDYLAKTAETVNYGGLDFLVPRLELQFVDKFEKANETVERDLRQKTDAEWLASAYSLDAELVHFTIDRYVITPELAKFQPAQEVAKRNSIILGRKLEQTKQRLSEELPNASNEQLAKAVEQDFILVQYCSNVGITDIARLIDANTGQLVDDVTKSLSVAESQRQVAIETGLRAKHKQVETILQSA